MPTHRTIIGQHDADRLIELLQVRLSALNDLHLTLKHVHWNVVGPNFIGVHQMIDPQVETVRGFADVLAERIAALGGAPSGTPSAIERDRTWDDYSLGRDTVDAHLAALDVVYDGVIASHRAAIDTAGKIDPVSEDILIGQTGDLEQFQWFMRAHLEDPRGRVPHASESTEEGAAAAVR
ncbi:DNA starvation/stationary phase protection protein [Gordonia sp. (in: high G+C Gram-positive bacteria)]|uniref:Dps family protein n=1 Tax=Gordonia sp. (in: high G+C Gram-positive bacteria) TaxID=84139 RepID=UPI0016B46AF2|nr:DNA starvation/stationary phase protection protein [Gordonia sp. (in: high G+C Gram-positive bacteria)]NLG47657.1 DNA starvation/stationary phase protection protein [Gordonia sp. (in: high G+C Gram-positive bacteria)]